MLEPSLHICFTGLCAWKVVQIVRCEGDVNELDEVDVPCERRAIAGI